MASVTVIPNGYTNTGSYNFTTSTNTSRQMSNAYANADNTSASARLTLASNRNSTRTSTMYLEFDKSAFDDIPASSTINSVTANVRYYVNNTTYVTAVSIQLHANTTAKGSAVTNRPTTSTKYSITPGSWTLSELKTVRLYISATHNASTSSAYLYLYGADITVNYTIPPSYTVSASSSASGVTVVPASQSVYQGQSASVTLNTNSNIVVRDNNTDVTSQLVQTAEAGTLDFIPDSCVDSTFTTDTSYPTSNGCSDTSSSTYARLKIDSSSPYAIYSFDTSQIPNNATITAVSCSVKAYVTGTSSNITTKSARLYAGSTAKGAAETIPTSLSVWNISSTGSWTASEIHNARIRFDGYYSGSSSYYIQFYGAELSVTYSTGNYVYVYTISNVQGNHTILVTGTSVSLPLRVKQNGTWKTAQKVFVKQNGSWVQATKVLVKDNGTWK